MHEGGDTPPASTIAATPDTFPARRRQLFLLEDREQFLPTIVVRPAASGEANSFRSAFETDRRGELHSTESKCQDRK